MGCRVCPSSRRDHGEAAPPNSPARRIGRIQTIVATGTLVLCQPTVKCFGRRHPAESFPWSGIEGCGDSDESLGAVHAQVRALREVLAQQSIGVLVGATLP